MHVLHDDQSTTKTAFRQTLYTKQPNFSILKVMLQSIYLPHSTYLALGLVLGILFINYKLILISLILLSIGALKFKKITTVVLNFFLVGIFLGWALYKWQISNFEKFKQQINHQTFNVTGTVVDYEKNDLNRFKYKLTIRTTKFQNNNKTIHINKFLTIYTQKFPPIYVGEKVLLKSLNFNFATKNFYFENFLIKNQICATVFVPVLDFEKNKKHKTFSLERYKRNILKKINFKMDNPTKIMFNSIFLGNKNHDRIMLNKIRNKFQTWGIVHYLARSGLHLVIINIIWQNLCNILQFPSITCNIMILLLMLAFAILSWTALPFLRALIMIIGYQICHLGLLQIHLLHILNISCILMLIYNPISIFFLDFQLSFLLTYGLVFLNELSYMKSKTLPKHSVAYKS